MTKHSKGPWTGGKEIINDANGKVVAHIQFKGVSKYTDISIEEGHANSSLMSTAPELLIEVYRSHAATTSGHNAGQWPDKCSLCALINKAEGKS